jgi:hypothetical protein
MGPHLHLMTQRKIRLLFEGKLPPKARTNLLKSVDRCPACAEYYARHQKLESALCGTDEPFTVFSMERTKKALFATLAEKTAPKKESSAFPRILAPAAIVAAAAVLAVFLFPGKPALDRTPITPSAVISPVTLVARGGFPQKAQADAGIRVFRVSKDAAHVSEGGDLFIDDTITFTYTYVNESGGALALFGIQNTGEIRWYYPGYNEKMSIPIEGDKVDEPLKDGILLAVNHRPGRLRIIALFTEEPLSTEEIEAATAAMRKDPELIASPTPITFEKSDTPPLQYSVMVEIGASR